MSVPTFTICIPTYNRAKTLSRSIESVLNQTYKDFELIIIDDGSEDNTKNIAENYTKDERVCYFYKENGGKYTALNAGIEMAKGELFVILDSDDALKENTLVRMASIYENLPDKQKFSGIMGRCESMDAPGILIGKRFPPAPFESSYIDFHYGSGPYGDCCECIRLCILKNYRFPSVPGEKFMAESYIFDKIGGLGYKLLCFNEIWKEVSYLDDGITKNSVSNGVASIRCTVLKYADLIENVFPNTAEKIKIRSIIRVWANYFRYILHDKGHIAIRIKKFSLYEVIAFPIGCLLFISDKKILKKQEAKNAGK